MKLFYYETKEEQGNVGDDLNPWLWPKIFGDVLDDNEQHLLVGIGTILNSKLPKADRYSILSSGVGYRKPPTIKPEQCDYLALRGPKSKIALGLTTQDPVLLDGGYLMPLYLPKPCEPIKGRVGFIPHVDSIILGPWEGVVEKTGLTLIDPRLPVEEFIQALCECEKVITEAMHGAILADAYRVPWLAVKAYDYINEFKWQDWALSLCMTVEFNSLVPIWRGDGAVSTQRKLINDTKRAVNYVGITPKNWTPVYPRQSSNKTLSSAAKMLDQYHHKGTYFLSDEVIVREATEKLHNRVLNFKASYIQERA